MEKPLNERQARFCLLVATPDRDGKYTPRYVAYMSAYPNCAKEKHAMVASSRLMKDERVRKRIQDLRRQIDQEWLEERLPFTRVVDAVRERLEDSSSPAPQLTAAKLALQMRSELRAPVAEHDFSHLSDEELIQKVMGLLE